MIIYLRYPRKRGFFSWDELSLVARTLGFHGDLFRQNFPAFIAHQTQGIAIELLLNLICDHSYLHAAVDATANHHFFPWNISAIHKTIVLLNARLLTFAEIQLVRVAYLFYEGSETKGLALDEGILHKALKLSGRMISPQKMLQRLFHMIPRLQEPGFLQLHEFLDLVLWSELYNPELLKEVERLDLAKDGAGCFKLSNFDELLQTVDSRLSAALDLQHEVEEVTYSESRSVRNAWKPDASKSYVNRMPSAKSNTNLLTRMLRESRCCVRQSKFRYGDRPATAPSMKYDSKVKVYAPSKIQITQIGSPLLELSSVQEDCCQSQSQSGILSSSSTPVGPESRRDKARFQPPRTSASSKYRIQPIVTDEDLQRTSQLIDDLKFDIATLVTRSNIRCTTFSSKKTMNDNSMLSV